MQKLITILITTIAIIFITAIPVSANYTNLTSILYNENKPYDIGDVVTLSNGTYTVKNIIVFEVCKDFNWNGTACDVEDYPIIAYSMEDYDNNIFLRTSSGILDAQAYCAQSYPNNKYCYRYIGNNSFTSVSYCQGTNCPAIAVNLGSLPDRIVTTTDLLLKQGSTTGYLDKYGLGTVNYGYNSTFFEKNTSYGEDNVYEVTFDTDIYENWLQLKLIEDDEIIVHEIQTESEHCNITKSSPQAPDVATLNCPSDLFIHYKKNYQVLSQYKRIAFADETPASYTYTLKFPEDITGTTEEIMQKYCSYIRSNYDVEIILNGSSIGNCLAREARFYYDTIGDNLDLNRDEYTSIYTDNNENYIFNWRPNTGIYFLDEMIVQIVNLFVPTGDSFNAFLEKYTKMFNETIDVQNYKILQYIKDGFNAPKTPLPSISGQIMGKDWEIDLSQIDSVLNREILTGITMKHLNIGLFTIGIIYSFIPKKNDT